MQLTHGDSAVFNMQLFLLLDLNNSMQSLGSFYIS